MALTTGGTILKNYPRIKIPCLLPDRLCFPPTTTTVFLTCPVFQIYRKKWQPVMTSLTASLMPLIRLFCSRITCSDKYYFLYAGMN